MDKVETLVIGAGVVGLAIGAELSKSQNVLVIEQNAHFGEHTSSRNSEVIHAGIYYPTESLKESKINNSNYFSLNTILSI